MGPSKKIFLFVLVVIIASFCLLHLAVNLNGKAFLVQKLKSIFGREVTVAGVRSTLPFTIIIRNVQIKGLFQVKEVLLEGLGVDIFRRGFNLSKVSFSGLTVHVEKPLKEAVPRVVPFAKKIARSATATNAPLYDLEALKIFSPSLSIKHLYIKDSSITFVDKSVRDKGIAITMKDLHFNIDNLCVPVREPRITSFDLKAIVPWQEGQEEGTVQAEGWINVFKRTMEASVNVQAIDGVYLNPYYSQWADMEKARIEKAKLNFTGSIHGLNNNVTAVCHLELSDIVFKPHPAEEGPPKAEMVAAAMMDIFKTTDKGKMVLDFTIRTRMDRPEFGLGVIRDAFQDKIIQSRKETVVQEAAQLPGKLLEGLFKSARDLTTAVVVGTISAGKEVGKTLGVSFKKEKKELTP